MNPYLEHKTTKKYRDWHLKRDQGRNPNQNVPHAPYGVGPGDRPIQGPPNWDQVWNHRTMGDDYKKSPLFGRLLGKPLLNSQAKWLKASSQLFRDISWQTLLGEGSFGEVWSVIVNKGGQKLPMACKVMRPEPSDASDFQRNIEYLLNDMNTLRRLQHKNIVKIEEMINIPDSRTGFPFAKILLLMELCDGDLNQLLADNPPEYRLSEYKSRHWFKQIGTAIKFMHENKIVHLDIKPRNIFYVYNDRNRNNWSKNPMDMTFKLGDFGLSITYAPDQVMSSATYRGTRGYIDREMKELSLPRVDTKKSDIYSLGVTLARSLLGRQNFHRISNTLHLEMTQQAMAPSSQYNLSRDAVKLIAKMTDRVGAKRPTIDEVLNEPWVNSKMSNPSPLLPLSVMVRTEDTQSQVIPMILWPLVIASAASLIYLGKYFD